MAEKLQKFNAAREAKIEEMYEKNPELRELSKEAMYQFEKSESVKQKKEMFGDKMKSFNDGVQNIQEKSKKMSEKSKQIYDNYGNKLDSTDRNSSLFNNEVQASTISEMN